MGWRSDIYAISLTNHPLFRYGVRQMGSFDTVEMFTIHIINNVYSGYKVTSFLPNIFFILIKMA